MPRLLAGLVSQPLHGWPGHSGLRARMGMMPTRILRDWTDSAPFEALSANAERLFVRLIMKADDYGRYHADVRLIRAGCFPLLAATRDADISHWIAECVKVGLVVVYQVKGRSYLAIRKFRQRTRQQVAKYPGPDGQPDDWRPPDDGELSVIGPTVDGQPSDNRRPDSDSDSDSDSLMSAGADGGHSSAFLRTWDLYPQKGRSRSSRKEAYAVWKALKLDAHEDEVVAGLEAWKQFDDWKRGFVQGFHLWLKNRRWTEPPQPEDPEPDETGFVRAPLTPDLIALIEAPSTGGGQ